MINVKQQVDYWRDGSSDALQTVPVLTKEGFFPEALFWTHLALEKALKAHVTVATGNHPPLIHNLIRLAELGRVVLSEEQLQLCDELNKWQGIARYGRSKQRQIDPERARAVLKTSMELREWLIGQLQI